MYDSVRHFGPFPGFSSLVIIDYKNKEKQLEAMGSKICGQRWGRKMRNAWVGNQ